MSIHINKNNCIGCKKCEDICPGNLIEVIDHKAWIMHEKDCWGCVSCIKECPTQAILLYLGADIGGRGAYLTFQEQDDHILWEIKKKNQTIERIFINPKDSNQY